MAPDTSGRVGYKMVHVNDSGFQLRHTNGSTTSAINSSSNFKRTANVPRSAICLILNTHKMEQKLICSTLLLFVALFHCAQCRPPSDNADEAKLKMVDPSEYPGDLSPETILKIQICERDAATMELCMRCAKVTKSDFIYPMCCNNDEQIKDFCHAYVYFGDDEGY